MSDHHGIRRMGAMIMAAIEAMPAEEKLREIIHHCRPLKKATKDRGKIKTARKQNRRNK